MGELNFGIKNAIFPLFFVKVLQNRACVPAMKKSPKGDLYLYVFVERVGLQAIRHAGGGIN